MCHAFQEEKNKKHYFQETIAISTVAHSCQKKPNFTDQIKEKIS